MKKFLNRPEDVLEEMIQGFLGIYPNLARLAGFNVLVRSDVDSLRAKEVTLLSGGGSGHEPAHAGFVGQGMLTAAVLGEVFTSPSADAVLAAVRSVAGPKGVLLIVKNYTGDRLNFGFAAESARAEGILVDTVTVADDVALAETQTRGQRRGIAGTVLVHKIAGAAAAAGKSIREVAQLAQAAADDLASMGISLSAGTIPAVGKPSYELGDNELELGLGIHGEPGVKRGPMRPADDLADEVIAAILHTKPLQTGTRLAVLVNNLGATTNMELAIFSRRALQNLRNRGMTIERVLVGTFVSSLEAAGISLSILPVDDARLELLDAPTSAPAWPNVTPSAACAHPSIISVAARPAPERKVVEQPDSQLIRCIRAACQALREAKEKLTELDSAVGDGDLGISLARGADAVESSLKQLPAEDPGETLKEIGKTLQRTMGGSSGPLYGVMFVRAGSALQSGAPWAEAFLAGCHAISDLGGAQEGDRTMLDALLPAARTFKKELEAGRTTAEAFIKTAEAAESGAQNTALMKPRVGRSSYLGDRMKGYPDPGAVAAAIWLRAVALSVKKYL